MDEGDDSAKIVPEHVERALRYVAALAEAGLRLTPDEIDQFAVTRPPVGRSMGNAVASMARLALPSVVLREPERVVGYCLKMGWLARAGAGVVLTPRAQALLSSLDERDRKQVLPGQPILIVLEPGDPWNGYKIAEPIHEAGAGMVVDPFFPADMLAWLAQETDIHRLLVRRDSATGYSEALNAAQRMGREIEVRTLPKTRLHDRAIVHADGKVTLLGSSLNSRGGHVSAMVHCSPLASAQYAQSLEGLWKSGKVLEPKPLRDSTETKPTSA